MGHTFDYSQDTEIDQNALDLEWKKQASLVQHWNTLRGDAIRDVDVAKEALDILIAEKDLEIRETSDKKPTESAIANMIKLDSEVQAAQQLLIEKRHVLSKLQAASTALEHKKSALECMVKLHGMNYFAEPTADLVARGKLEDMASAKTRDRVQSRLNQDKVPAGEKDQPLPRRGTRPQRQ